MISELRKPRAEQRVLDFVAATPLSELYVSIVTFVELRFGIDRSPDAAKRAALEDWLGNSVRPMFDPTRILPVTEDVLLRWRALMEDGRKRGHTFSQPDLIIAATAAHNGLTVVTRDPVHFVQAGVPVLNPWER